MVREEQYSPPLAPRVALARAQWVTSVLPVWRTHCSNHRVSLENGKAILTIYFFRVLTLWVFVFATHVSPPIVSEKGSLTDRIQEHTTHHHMSVDAVISFLLGMALKKTSNKTIRLQMAAGFPGVGVGKGRCIDRNHKVKTPSSFPSFWSHQVHSQNEQLLL